MNALDHFSKNQIFYEEHVDRLFEQYEEVTFEEVHASWLKYLPASGRILDIGAGSGRDAAALASMGYQVYAVEPSASLRGKASRVHTSQRILWWEDRLPALANTLVSSLRYDLILVSAVWMHLDAAEQIDALEVLARLLKPNGHLVITYRDAASQDDRAFFDVDIEGLKYFAARNGLMAITYEANEDLYQRGFSWHLCVFQYSDESLRALPLVRHIIFDDAKSSTYKPGLLYALTKICKYYSGMVLSRDKDWVEIPMGLVALTWMRIYHPLIHIGDLWQVSKGHQYGFSKADGFQQLRDVPAHHFAPGQTFEGATANALFKALHQVSKNIKEMPAEKTKYPDGQTKVYRVTWKMAGNASDRFVLDQAFLSRFGSFKIPTHLWYAMSDYDVFFEPSIRQKWENLVRSYYKGKAEFPVSSEGFQELLDFGGKKRDTSLMRKLVLEMSETPPCVWTGKRLILTGEKAFQIDHCFPYSVWENNDLWNLFPTSRTANRAKADKIPKRDLLQNAKPRILLWWEYLLSSPYAEQFKLEAHAAMSIREGDFKERLFEAMVMLRDSFVEIQRLEEWPAKKEL